MKKVLCLCVIAVCCTACLHSCATLQRPSAARGAIIGGLGGYNGYTVIGTASSESDAALLARNKGYSEYIYDSVTGMVMGK